MKFLSRKLLAFAVATILLFFKYIDQDAWLTLACVYVGFQAAQNAISQIKTVVPRPPKPLKHNED